MELDMVQLISQVGFPIAVATYCLVTLNKTMKEHSEVLSGNTAMLGRICDKLGAGGDGA